MRLRPTAWLFYLFLSLKSFAISVPYLSGAVVDTARLLPASDFRQVEAALETFHKQTGVQMAVLITESLEGEDIASYAIQVADAWKLGKKKEDRGLLFVIAPNDRKMRLEVGYGLEGEIPDAIAKRILSQVVGPRFKQRQYAQGILDAIQVVSDRLEKKPTPELEGGEQQGLPLIGWMILIALVILVLLVKGFFFPFGGYGGYGGYHSNDRWWGGGGSGGGGFSGGGGGFGGGGASDSW